MAMKGSPFSVDMSLSDFFLHFACSEEFFISSPSSFALLIILSSTSVIFETNFTLYPMYFKNLLNESGPRKEPILSCLFLAP
jgi:hypothetical protein